MCGVASSPLPMRARVMTAPSWFGRFSAAVGAEAISDVRMCGAAIGHILPPWRKLQFTKGFM